MKISTHGIARSGAERIAPTPRIDPRIAWAAARIEGITEARFGTAPFNVLRGPGVAPGDLGVLRQVHLPREMNLQLPVEAFNVTTAPGSTTQAATSPTCISTPTGRCTA